MNTASRMESTGKACCIQVSQDTYEQLDYLQAEFVQRGELAVKGKGMMMTYLLEDHVDCSDAPPLPDRRSGELLAPDSQST